ncbi:MAG: AmmeMemoRadiSam system protein B [Candidatus Zixiibacteriota bacterium]
MTDSKSEIRKPAVAGVFYPENPIELGKAVATLFSETEKTPLAGRPMAIIVPHSSYPYSGKIAARAFKLLEGEQYETVIVISPSSTVFFKGSAVYDGGGYETPFGIVEIDRKISEKIASINQSVFLSKKGHAAAGARGEHALEVQLPFLQVVLGKFKLVAIVMGEQEEDTAKALGQALAATLGDTNCLIIASSNLSHFHTQKEARELDVAVQHAIEKYDPHLLMKTISSGKGEASGAGAIAAALVAAKQLGGKDIKFLGYGTSGETTGQMDEVVGYMSAAILTYDKPPTIKTVLGSQGKGPFLEDSHALSEKQKAELKKLAFAIVEAKLKDTYYHVPEIHGLDIQRGVYVTILVDGKVASSAGRVRVREPLFKAVAEMSANAAEQGIEAATLKPGFLKSVDIRISALASLERVQSFDEIEIGRHGLMLKLDMHSALILPGEAKQQDWDVTQFLEQISLKAGLPKSSYKDKFAEIYKFTAEEF